MKVRTIALLLATFATLGAMATDVNIPIKGGGKEKEKDGKVIQRAPINLPIEVIYNTETLTVQVTSLSADIDGEVYIYNAFDELEDYSPTLNCILTVTESDYHTIVIDSENWTGYGVIE